MIAGAPRTPLTLDELAHNTASRLGVNPHNLLQRRNALNVTPRQDMIIQRYLFFLNKKRKPNDWST